MDTYVLLRFLRTNLMIASSCLAWSIVVLGPVYYSSPYDLQSSSSFGNLTMDHVENGTWRLWVCFLSTCGLTALVIALVDRDWRMYIIRRRDFFRLGDSDFPGGHQKDFTVTAEFLPPELCSEDALKDYFEKYLFPGVDGKVFSVALHRKQTGPLKEAIARCESTCMSLERVGDSLLKQNARNLRSVEKTNGVTWQARLREPTLRLSFLCLPWRAKTVHEYDVVTSNPMMCCSKTVKAIPYWRRLLSAQNKEAVAIRERIMGSDKVKMTSNSAFVTFESNRQIATDASQVLLSNDVAELQLSPALDPRDVLWENACMKVSDINTRISFTSFAIKIFAVFIFIPLLVFCNVFGDLESLSKVPGLQFLRLIPPSSFAYIFITTQVPPLLQALLLDTMPDLLQFVSTSIERVKLRSVAQQSILDRGFAFQLVNIYFTLLGSTLAKTLQQLVAEPTCIFQLLGNTVPAVAGYFIQLILIKALFGLSWELARITWFLDLVAFNLKEWVSSPSVSRREKFFTPSWDDGIVSFSSGCLYPGFLFVMVLGLTYAVMVPFMNIVTTFFFFWAYVIYKHHCLFVFLPASESGGKLFPSLYDYILMGLQFANATMVGYIFIKGGALQFVLLFALFPVVESFRKKTQGYMQHTPARPGRDRAFLFPGKIPDSSQDHRSCDKLFLGKSRGPAYVALTQATAGRVLPGKARSRACPRAVSPARILFFTQSAIFPVRRSKTPPRAAVSWRYPLTRAPRLPHPLKLWPVPFEHGAR